MLGKKIKELREAKGYLQRQVAAKLEVDTAYVCKVENEEKRISKSHIRVLGKMLGASEKELLSLWLADKVMSVIEQEELAESALSIVNGAIKKNKVGC